MCGNLRNASAKEMAAFIQGKTIAKPALSKGEGRHDMPQSSPLKIDRQQPVNPYASKSKNPYATKSMRNGTMMTDPQHQSTIMEENLQPKPQDGPLLERAQSATVPGLDTYQTTRAPLRCLQNNSGQQTARPASANGHPLSSVEKTVSPFVLAAHRPQIYQVGPVPLDVDAAKEWIYPVHLDYPVRDYQLEISQTAIQYNTLVSLPTGLGKTLIAAVVLYNFYRWFPDGGKVIFLAPTLPLVDQQVKACYQVMGIPACDTAVLNGKVSAVTRESLWNERRVFFCTPQTVEKDIEAGRCPASQVVCLVLDEAHKAMGNFAYTKVVESCEAAGAHFRILGLSATPGAKVQQVQKVIDALRITRLEARSEDEVKEYIHERHNEIVVVKKRSICHDIEQRFHSLIEPIMTKLRANTNIRQKIGSSDHTLTSFCIHRARQHHHETTSDHRFDGYFIAAQKLIDARSNLFSHGIGSVRAKLLELRNTPQRGVLSTVVKSPEFEALVDAVISASSGKHSQETAEDKKGNNPKLEKLDEILREHFLRADASGYTTRAIVFSQWRDSVSEIVDVLSLSQPLIRPRHFVGQSSGSVNKVGAMKGMPQKVQQQVIRDFQEGTFNVLVCTCIGEEGLDIGEVDLIVNYDTLRSPIRMIQRVGRTGRKRDGRVVCLISEGQEQKDMLRSKNNEKSLQRALRRSDNFMLRPNRVMFPEEPRLVKRTMAVTEKLRLSQVGGHAAPLRTKKETPAELIDNWKLSAQVESIRYQTFGPMVGIRSNTTSFPVCIKRKLLRARAKSHATHNGSVDRSTQRAHTGTSTMLLLSMETLSSEKGRSATIRKNRTVERDCVGLFPLEGTECSSANFIIRPGWDERVPLPTLAYIKPAVALPPQSEKCDTPIHFNSIPAGPPKDHSLLQNSNQLQGCQPTTVSFKPFLAHNESRQAEENDPICESPAGARAMTIDERLSQGVKFKLPTPPVSSSESDDDDDETGVESRREIDAVAGTSVAPTPKLKLPTPNPSSDSEMEDTDDEGEEGRHPDAQIRRMEGVAARQVQHSEPTHSVGGQEMISVEGPFDIERPQSSSSQFLLLPTQDSSSSEDSECADDGISVLSGKSVLEGESADAPFDETSRLTVPKHGEADLQAPTNGAARHIFACNDTIHTVLPNDKFVETGSCSPIKSNEIAFNADLVDTPNSANLSGKKMKLRHSLLSQPPPLQFNDIEPDLEFHESSPELVTRRSRTVSRKNMIMTQRIDTTPCRSEHTDTPTANQESREAADCLVDTPVDETGRSKETQDQDASDIVCAVCHCSDSHDDDPIVLCDGVNNISCDLAVHASCYSLETSVLSRLDEWRCDLCEGKGNAKALALDPRCLVCQVPGGILKHSSMTRSGVWIHPYCMSWTDESAAISCDFCSFPGASTCAFESCRRAAHPHCVRDTAEDKCWLTIVDTSEKSSAMFCFQHRQEKHSLYRFRPVEEETRLPKCFVLPSCRVEKLISNTSARRRRSSSGACQHNGRWLDKATFEGNNSKNGPRSRNEPSPNDNDRRQRLRQNLMKRHRGMLNSFFIHSEADIDSDEDIEGDDEEESELRRIDEEEELAALDFINDSSQLGTYTQDVLDCIDHDDAQSISIHRRLDIENERKRQFATPILNRRMTRQRTDSRESDAWDESQNSSATRSSLKGLGNCHFIRSVIEHARRGGEADDIEAVYNEVEHEVSLEEVGGLDDDMELNQPIRPLVLEYVPSDDDTDDCISGGEMSSPRAPAPPGLTVEQKARMEEKRLEALSRRQGKA